MRKSPSGVGSKVGVAVGRTMGVGVSVAVAASSSLFSEASSGGMMATKAVAVIQGVASTITGISNGSVIDSVTVVESKFTNVATESGVASGDSMRGTGVAVGEGVAVGKAVTVARGRLVTVAVAVFSSGCGWVVRVSDTSETETNKSLVGVGKFSCTSKLLSTVLEPQPARNRSSMILANSRAPFEGQADETSFINICVLDISLRKTKKGKLSKSM